MKTLLAILSLSVIAFSQAGPQAGSGPATANLWVDTNGGTCTRQSTPGAWVDAQGCSSFQAAQTAASAGDTVVIKNGTYAAQSITTGQKASPVRYFAETYGSVLLSGDLNITVDQVEMTGVTSTGTTNTRHSFQLGPDPVGCSSCTDILLAHGSWGHGAFSNSGVTLDHVQIGDMNECTGPQEDALRGNSTNTISNFTLTHSIIFKYFKNPSGCDTNHSDGIQIFSNGNVGPNILIDGNVFDQNDTSNIETQSITGSWIVQNNFLGNTVNGGNNLDIGRGACGGLVIQNNVTAQGTMNNGVTCTGTSTQRNNIYINSVPGSCSAITTSEDHEIFPSAGGGTCGTNAKRCTPNWLNGTPAAGNNYDIRLSSADTCAKDYSNASFPATDFYGTARPQGATADAGAFEIVAGGTTTASLSVSSLSFSATLTGSTSSDSPKTVTLTNTGTLIWQITNIQVSGDFSNVGGASANCSNGLIMSPSTSCDVRIAFTPTQIGNRTGTLTFTDTATGSPHTVSLTGTGQAQTAPAGGLLAVISENRMKP